MIKTYTYDVADASWNGTNPGGIPAGASALPAGTEVTVTGVSGKTGNRGSNPKLFNGRFFVLASEPGGSHGLAAITCPLQNDPGIYLSAGQMAVTLYGQDFTIRIVGASWEGIGQPNSLKQFPAGRITFRFRPQPLFVKSQLAQRKARLGHVGRCRCLGTPAAPFRPATHWFSMLSSTIATGIRRTSP